MTNQQILEKYTSLCDDSNYRVKRCEVDPCSFIDQVPNGLLHMMFRNARKQQPFSTSFIGSYDVKLIDELNHMGLMIYGSSNIVHQHQTPGDSREWHQSHRMFDVQGVWIKVTVVLQRQRNSPYTLELEDVVILHDGSSCDVVSKLVECIHEHEIKEEFKPTIGIIKQTQNRLYIANMDMEDNQTYSENYYNDDFPEFLEDMTYKLSQNTSGLFLLHGEPGTGKSSAIRYIIKQLYEVRRFVFIPPHMTHSLALPEFADLLTGDGKGSVLVVEDAEKALMKREGADGFHNSELVSSVLNLTDGLYADITKTAIIATYNCDRNNIDSALLRKGRLKSEYEFKKLSAIKAQQLADELGNNMNVEVDVTLADVFNYGKQYSNSESINKPKRVVGFGS